MAESAQISVLELRRLLTELRDKRPDICIRFRLLGKMWFIHFKRIVLVTETGVILNDEVNSKLVNIRDLSQVMQFELDKGFQGFAPHFHYNLNALY